MTREQLGQISTVEDLMHLKLEVLTILDANRQALSSLRRELQQAGFVASEKRYYSPKEIAMKLGVTVRTINNWIHEGVIEAFKPNGFRGAWQIPASELPRLLNVG